MRPFLLTLALFLPAITFAQTTYDDGLAFGTRVKIEAEAKLAPGLHLTAHEETRFYFNGEDVVRFHSGIELEYKLFSFLKVGAEYELINRFKHLTDEKKDGTVLEEDEWSIRHRGNFFVTGTLKTRDWQFSLKETFRMTCHPGEMNTFQSPRTALALKSKVTVKYLDLGAVVPFAAFEVRNTFNDAAYSAVYNASAIKNKDRYLNEEFLGYTHVYVNRLRSQLGTTIKFSKHHEVEFSILGDYYREKEIDTNREGSDNWKENGLVLKAIDWHTGLMISARAGYKWSF